jgi:outer membrane protein assembly factor BamA
VTFVIAEPLTVTVGVSMQRLEPQLAGTGTDAANSFAGTLRYHRLWNSGDTRQEADAGYSLRTAANALSSDYVYTRHAVKANYQVRRGHHTVAFDMLAGRIAGDAPLFERFVLGNGGTLRGWNKFDLAPLGGDRVVHGSVEYSYQGFQVFYDTGAIWDRGADADAKQSLGVGFGRAGKNGFLLALAFPLRAGGLDPIFIAGFNF